AWDAYTPYEIRHVGAFVRLGWKERAHELLDYYLADRRPLAWNGWPEVVTRDPREPRFLGDLPHGWVASDFIRSLLDLFAYEDRDGQALVLAAGVPESWLAAPEGIAVRRLATPWGELSYRLARLGPAEGGGVRFRLETAPGTGRLLEPPPGGLVFTWPLAGTAGAARVDGRPVEVGSDGRLIVRGVPATVDFLPREEQ
ncbi:MAG TPA: coagulation factor 5/8 type domain-containing protein, partial [Thermoanaerobaculia bacterium]|nr:coagulation factor 5/8 type domain-containing protein [Thermoanaerobaculia bacterium]